MRIALFAPYLPAPPNTGGRLRTYHLARAARELGSLHLFATAAYKELESEAAQRALDLYETVNVAPARLRFAPALRLPARVRTGVAARVAHAFERAHQQRPFDLLWVEHAHAAAVARQLDVPWVLDEHNIESEYLRGKLSAGGRLGVLARRELLLLEAWERALWRSANRVVCVTNHDADVVASVRGSGPEVIPNGVELAAITPRWPSQRQGATVLFIGLMNHPPNEQGAQLLAEQVMPLLRRRLPQARLVLCGHNPSRRVRALASEHVVVTGSVPAVAPYLDGACVYANALWQGGGSSLKVLEALAAGVPLISTSVGVRGFALAANEHYWPAEDAEGFAQAIFTSVEQKEEAERRARRGREFAEAYDFQALGLRFKALLQQAVRKRA